MSLLMGHFQVEAPPPNVPVIQVNGTPTQKIPEDEMKAAGLAFEGIILALGLLGNIGLMAAMKRSPRLKYPIFQLMLALSVADMIFLSAVIAPHLLDYFTYKEQWVLGQVGCSLLNFLGSVVPMVSSSLLVVCCWERFYAVCRPRTAIFITTKRMTCIILVVWFLGVAGSTPYLVKSSVGYAKYTDGTLFQTCTLSLPDRVLRLYHTASALLFYAVAGVVATAFLICSITKAMGINFDYDEVKDDFKNHILRCIVLTTVTYFLLWLPSRILLFSELHSAHPITDPFFLMVSRQMAAISGAVKPYVYLAASSQFRKSVIMALSCCSNGAGRPSAVSPVSTATNSTESADSADSAADHFDKGDSEKPLMNPV